MVSTVMFNKTCSFHLKEEIFQGKRSCKQESKCELVGFDSLPDFLKDNEFILDYYRSEWPLKQTILSVFSIHNETLNVWTHLVGFFLFLALTLCAVNMAPWYAAVGTDHQVQHMVMKPEVIPNPTLNASRFGYVIGLQHLSVPQADRDVYTPEKLFTLLANHTIQVVEGASEPLTRWPFYVYLAGAMFCLLVSGACHLLSCHSEQACHAMLHFDYAGISTLIVASYYPLIYYSFLCAPVYQTLYLGFITLFGAATIVVTLVPAFQAPEFRVFRTLLFGCLGLSGMVPFAHKMVVFADRPEAVVSAEYELLMFAFYGLGGLLYMTRVPERWMPGMFDLVGHSHQLFHVLIVAAAYSNYLATTVYLQWRDMDRC